MPVSVKDHIKACRKGNLDVSKCIESYEKKAPSNADREPEYIMAIYGEYSKGGSKSKIQDVGGAILNIIQSGLATQEQDVSIPDIGEEYVKIDDILGKIVEKKGAIKDLDEIGQELLSSGFGQLENYFKQQTGLLHQINKEAGLTGKMSKDFREELTEAGPELIRLGIGFKELADAATQAVKQSGRFNLIATETFKDAGKVASAFVGTLSDMVAMFKDFEQIGLGASDTIKRVETAGKTALELGLRSKSVTQGIKENVAKINEYGFKNGIEGLSQMVRKSIEFRTSMNEVFKIADKVMNPEGALELSANLQVLGGAIGDFNDPLKLMYMATNNVEGLQDALIGAAGSLATYNSEQGRFEITGANLRRAKEMASQLGVEYSELAKGAIAAAERTSATSALMARGLKLDEKQKEFLTNIAQMKGGKMMVEVNTAELRKKLDLKDGQTSVALEELNQTQADLLLEYQKEFEDKKTDEIVRDQATNVENIMRDVNYMAAIMKIQAGKFTTEALDDLLGAMGTSGEEMAKKFTEFTSSKTIDIKQFSYEKVKQEASSVGQKIRDEKKGKKQTSVTPTPTPPTGGGLQSTATGSQPTGTQPSGTQSSTTTPQPNQLKYIVVSNSTNTVKPEFKKVIDSNNPADQNQTNVTTTQPSNNQNQNPKTVVPQSTNTQTPVSVVTPTGQNEIVINVQSLMTKETDDSPLLDSVKSIEKILLSKDNTIKTATTSGVVKVSKEPEEVLSKTGTLKKVEPESLEISSAKAASDLTAPNEDKSKGMVASAPTSSETIEKVKTQLTPLTEDKTKGVITTTPTTSTESIEPAKESVKKEGLVYLGNQVFDFSKLVKAYESSKESTPTAGVNLNKESSDAVIKLSNTLLSEPAKELEKKEEQTKKEGLVYLGNQVFDFSKLVKAYESSKESTPTAGVDLNNQVSDETTLKLGEALSSEPEKELKKKEEQTKKEGLVYLGGQTLDFSKLIESYKKDKETKLKEGEPLNINPNIGIESQNKVDVSAEISGLPSEIREQILKEKEILSKSQENIEKSKIVNLEAEKYFTKEKDRLIPLSNTENTQITESPSVSNTDVKSLINNVTKQIFGYDLTNITNNKSQLGDVNNLSSGYSSFISNLNKVVNEGDENNLKSTNLTADNTSSNIYSPNLGTENNVTNTEQNVNPFQSTIITGKGPVTTISNLDVPTISQGLLTPIESTRDVSKEKVNIENRLREEYARTERIEQSPVRETKNKHTIEINAGQNIVGRLAQTILNDQDFLNEVSNATSNSKSYLSV